MNLKKKHFKCLKLLNLFKTLKIWKCYFTQILGLYSFSADVKATTQVSKAGGSDSYEMSPSSYVTMIVFLVAFFCGIVVLSSILVFRLYVRRRGYRKIDRKDKVLFGNTH